MAVTNTRADQYRQLARDCHFLARSLSPEESRSAMIRMAEEWDRLANQQEQAADLNRAFTLIC
jgi:hypothetical protein